MFEIKGSVTTALCYAKTVEEEAIEQIRRMCSYPLTEGSKVRIMPDVHAGKACTIGTTMTITEKACPNVVGVDIGCGMYTVRLSEADVDFEKVDEACHFIPSGMNIWEDRLEGFNLSALRCYRHLKDVPRLGRSLGTLGGGNHFIEIDRAADGTCYLVIHSGSRNLGKQVAEIYQRIAVELHSPKKAFEEKRDEIIRSYRETGRSNEIQAALEKIVKQLDDTPSQIPDDICWLYGSPLDDYLHDVEICQAFARRSREKMGEVLLERTGLKAVDAFHTIHNYIDTDEMILRKGAIAAHKGERVLIPINMRDGAIIALGKGNPKWNQSAPHGAGRILSRKMARSTLDLRTYQEAMTGIYTSSVNENTLDESPMAYKSLDDILDVIHESVEIVDIIKPVFNFKASDDELPPWTRKKDEHENDPKE